LESIPGLHKRLKIRAQVQGEKEGSRFWTSWGEGRKKGKGYVQGEKEWGKEERRYREGKRRQLKE
jgi:hypothetical protein